MSTSRLDMKKTEPSPVRAREDGWLPGKNGGQIRPFRKGEGQVPGFRKPSNYVETLHLARKSSPEAMRTLIRALQNPDQRVAVVAANSILERAWGKVKEAKEEPQPEAHVDLSQLTAAELAILAKLVDSGRLGGSETRSPPQIEGPAPDIE
jgi:hypothetical protein